jgi:hypothetical protein
MDDANRLREQCALGTKFWSKGFAGLTAVTYRDKGAEALLRLWFKFLTAHQSDRYKEGLRKLGIHNDPPAVAAAKYHYFTNIIGGLDMEYVEESPKKVWVRYMGPMWMYAGVALLTVPSGLRRHMFSAWHPRNGLYMGCPRLGYVGTKFITEGDPCDEGYFLEYDRDLGPDEIMRYEVARHTPEFDPAKAPRLDPASWPEARILKARRGFAGGYFRVTVEVLQNMFGEFAANQIVQHAMRGIAIQFMPEFRNELRAPKRDFDGVVATLTGILDACGQSFSVETLGEKKRRIVLRTMKPFDDDAPEGLRAALFQFQEMGTRVLNGHLRITRHANSPSGPAGEAWDIEDTGRWLW